MKRKVFVIGGHTVKFIGNKHPDFIGKNHPEFGKKTNPTIEDYIREAAQGALKSTNVSPSLIDKAWIGNFAGELFSKQGHLGAALVGGVPELKYKPVTRVEAACASGGLAFSHSVDAIQSGSDICFAIGAEVQTTVSAREGGDYLARASHYSRERKLDDFTFPAVFASRIKQYMSRFPNYTTADLGYLSEKAYSNANKNPLAHMKAVKMNYDTASKASDKNPNFLSNKDLSPFLRGSDCSQVSDGASALIVVSEEGLKKLGKSTKDAIEVLSVAHSTGNLYEDPVDATILDTTKAAVERAYKESKLTPQEMEVAEVHDCFTIAEVLMYEALGFAEHGKGIDLIKQGHTQIDGKIPVNTGGGLIGFGHPVGATGIKQVLEIYRQMKRQCGEYQIKKTPKYGITSNMGGNDKTAVVSIFKNLD